MVVDKSLKRMNASGLGNTSQHTDSGYQKGRQILLQTAQWLRGPDVGVGLLVGTRHTRPGQAGAFKRPCLAVAPFSL